MCYHIAIRSLLFPSVKPLTFSILRLLSDGQFHSGEGLARQLDISRASVWNALKSIDDVGVSVHKVRGRGYCLAEPIQWVNKQLVLDALGQKSDIFDIEVYDVLASTNSLLMQKVNQDAKHGSCVVAELQTQGRGRRGRTWHADLGGALTFSLLWRFNHGAGGLSGLSLAIGVAILRALREIGLTNVALKWPNDVLHQYRKLAGILIELQGDVLGPSAVVIGIGLNLRLTDRTKESVDQAIGDIYSITGEIFDRNLLLATLLIHLADVLVLFESKGFSALREEWLASHAYQDRPVRMLMPGGEIQDGHVVDVSEDGSLIVNTRFGPKNFTNGEISLRGVI